MPLRSARSSSIWYSLPVRCTRVPLISAILLSRLTTRSPYWINDWEWPLERRTMAWMRATNSSLRNGLVNVVVGAAAETFDLILDVGKPGEDQGRRLDLRNAQTAQYFEARHVWQI